MFILNTSSMIFNNHLCLVPANCPPMLITRILLRSEFGTRMHVISGQLGYLNYSPLIIRKACKKEVNQQEDNIDLKQLPVSMASGTLPHLI